MIRKSKFSNANQQFFRKDNIFEVDWVSGGAMMIRRDLFEDWEDLMKIILCILRTWICAFGPKSKAAKWW